MRRLAAFCVAVLLAGCASQDVPPPENWTVTYYDRNRDGIVDYEALTQRRSLVFSDFVFTSVAPQSLGQFLPSLDREAAAQEKSRLAFARAVTWIEQVPDNLRLRHFRFICG